MIHRRMQGTRGVVLLSPQVLALSSPPLLLSLPIGAFLTSELGWSLDCQEQGLPRMCACPSACDAPDEQRSEGSISCRGSSRDTGITMAMMTRDSRKSPAFVTRTKVSNTERLGPALWILLGPHGLLITLDPS